MRVKIWCHTLDHHVRHKVIKDDEMTLILNKNLFVNLRNTCVIVNY